MTDPRAGLSLARHKFLETSDPAEARDRISDLFAPHTQELPNGDAGFRTRYHHARLKALSLYYFEYDCDVTIRSGAMHRFYLLLMPVRGETVAAYGDTDVPVPVGHCYIVNPFAPIALHWRGRSATRVIKIDRADLERQLNAATGRTPAERLSFSAERALLLKDLEGLAPYIDLLFGDLDSDDPVLSSRTCEATTEALFLSLLLRRYPNNVQALLRQPGAGVAPYYVKRVEEYIRLHAAEDLSIDDMVRVAGVSARTLFKGFRDFRGVGPKRFLKQVRLDQVRADLMAATDETTITDIAAGWGFHHLGNFARDYRLRHGEPPSATLQSAKSAMGALPPQ